MSAAASRLEQLSHLVPGLSDGALADLAALPEKTVPPGTVLFRPGDEPPGFVLVLAGEVTVSLTGPNGREIELYSVVPGQTCVQTTLCLLGEQDYSAEAVARSELRLLIVPKGLFHRLLDSGEGFRRFVFRALGSRLADVTALLEQVAFVRIESRLAGELLRRAGEDGQVIATHQELAAAIGSAREVISRRLESLARQDLLELERGAIRITDRCGLERFRDGLVT